MPDVIGIDHVYVSVSDLDRSEKFYDVVMEANRHFGYVLRPARTSRTHDPYAPGFHHLCFRVETEDQVQEAAKRLSSRGIMVPEARRYPEYAPDYFACFFSDPDGVRLEITNYRRERRQRHDHWEELAGSKS
jgi:catechol 2,3-dioxygenase-like lactoylglutathione lyase family enzyme